MASSSPSSSAPSAHTFNAKCRLAPIPRAAKEDGLPPIEAQFFYSSLIPIDDPLSTSSVLGGSSDPKSGKTPLRPFSRADNTALEKAWLGLQSDADRKDHREMRSGRPQDPETAKTRAEKRALLVQGLALSHWEKHRSGFQRQDLAAPSEDTPVVQSTSVCCSQLVVEVVEELEQTFCSLARAIDHSLKPDRVEDDIVRLLNRLRHSAARSHRDGTAPVPDDKSTRSRANSAAQPVQASPRQSGASRSDGRNETSHSKNPVDAIRSSVGRPRSSSETTDHSSRNQTPVGSPNGPRHPSVDVGITGKPFVRVGTEGDQPPPSPTPFARFDTSTPAAPVEEIIEASEVFDSPDAVAARHAEALKEGKLDRKTAEIAVGVSRLHMVNPHGFRVPSRSALMLLLRDTMLPVPPAVANQLEAGYQELRPWTETWSDELRCALDVGPLGEEKVSHRLWPKTPNPQLIGNHELAEEPYISSDPFCAARCFHGEAAAEGSIEPLLGKVPSSDHSIRPFSNYHVMYKNELEAFMLKPSLKPSAYYGRRPLVKIMKGVTIGIPVVRGFDRKRWERMHHKKQTPNKPGISETVESDESHGRGVCPACKAEKDRAQVNDLVLVAHGIGQKFAERVESFHFTHAINGFRRAVNIELGNPIVQQVLQNDHRGLMILPLNWRMGLSFEDGGPLREEDKADFTADGFGLKDIEPKTIPAVRSMISDVMFDIPFYMSHHKGKMIKALVSEANRVYRLWCRNNPGFAENGRVHLIGHSLGSAMALEILSRQPTLVPPIDLSLPEPETRFFEFDTTNLFLAGSPAGFFLLLERAVLMPRRSRRKPGADLADTVDDRLVGEEGTFGCLAVDNIYNILAREDPIAYLLNGAVDPSYASSLKKAYLPSTSTTMFKAVGDAMRYVVPGMGPAPNPLAPDAEVERPQALRLPSQLELEVHDFTREEVAEKKFHLLNDNGQIDYFLRSGGGPLEIQYLNMLSAHSCYWTHHDFIRMLCLEIGRKPGRANTLPAMRAVKATKRIIPGANK